MNKNLKLFVVKTEIITVVLAEDEYHAREVAADNKNDILDEADLFIPKNWQAFPCKKLPTGWEENCLPWGSEDDYKTVGYYMNINED